MSSIELLIKADGFQISVEQMRKDLGIKKKHFKPIQELRDIKIEPKSNEPYQVTKTRVYEPKKFTEVPSNADITFSGIVVKEHIRATNQCKCGCYLHDHSYTNDGKLPCKKHRNCKDYEH